MLNEFDPLLVTTIALACCAPFLAWSWKSLAVFSLIPILPISAIWIGIIATTLNPDNDNQPGLVIALALLSLMLIIPTALTLFTTATRFISLLMQRYFDLARWKVLPIEFATVSITALAIWPIVALYIN